MDMYEELYAPLPDAGKYLERMGMGPVRKADKETLDSLVLTHQRTVPFENLDVYDSEYDILTDPVSVYDKFVTRGRGGYCFELNAGFMALLKALGYDCYAVTARVIWNKGGEYMPPSHRGTVVTIGGTRYFCDVGFGGPMPQGAILLDSREEQQSGPNVFKFTDRDGDLVLGRMVPDGFEPILRFSAEPRDPVDFLALNYYLSKNPASWFRSERMLNLGTEDGAISLTGSVLKIHKNGEVTEVVLRSEEEIKTAMREYFGVVVDFALKRDWE